MSRQSNVEKCMLRVLSMLVKKKVYCLPRDLTMMIWDYVLRSSDLNLIVIYTFQRKCYRPLVEWHRGDTFLEISKLTITESGDFEMPKGQYYCCTEVEEYTALTMDHFDKSCTTFDPEDETFNYIINCTLIKYGLTPIKLIKIMENNDKYVLEDIEDTTWV